MPGYSAVFRNRESIKGGGVGAYIHESIQFKRRCDIENLHPDLEHLWLELPGRNKHSKALIGIMYRSKLILSESDWLERVDSLLGYLTMSWDGLLVVTGDVNIDMRKPSDNLTRKYQTLLEAFSLKQIVTKPTRVTRTSKTLIDHVVNFPQNITYTDVNLPCSMVGDHDAPFACINVRVPRFQPRFKFLWNEKELDENAFKEDFSLLSLDVVYGLESPDDMVDALNSLMKDCLDRHAPLRRVKVTRPPAPWLQTEEIRQLQKDRDQLRAEAHRKGGETSWAAFRDVHNKIKSVVGKARRSFLANALLSKRPKEVWKVTHRVLHPSPKPLCEDPEKLNRYFISTAARTLGTKPDSTHDLLDLVRSFPDQADELSTFALRNVSRSEVLKEISRLHVRSDCSTGVDQIPVKLVKLASDYLSGPLTYIINSCINTSSFQKTWKTARVSRIPTVDKTHERKGLPPSLYSA